MTTQINLKFPDEFLNLAQDYAKAKGYLNVQELAREALRDKIFGELEVKPSYKKILASKEANTYLSDEETKKFEKELLKRAR